MKLKQLHWDIAQDDWAYLQGKKFYICFLCLMSYCYIRKNRNLHKLFRTLRNIVKFFHIIAFNFFFWHFVAMPVRLYVIRRCYLPIYHLLFQTPTGYSTRSCFYLLQEHSSTQILWAWGRGIVVMIYCRWSHLCLRLFHSPLPDIIVFKIRVKFNTDCFLISNDKVKAQVKPFSANSDGQDE